MPIFEYRCQTCDHRFESLVRGGATPECPVCRSVELEKQHSVFAVSTGASSSSSLPMATGACGTCGDPRGPGACSMN